MIKGIGASSGVSFGKVLVIKNERKNYIRNWRRRVSNI